MTQASARDPLARLAPPLFVFMWATGFVVARLVAPDADPFTFLAVRFGIAAAILAAAALAVGAPWPGSASAWRDGIVAGMLLHGAYLSCVFWAIKHGMPSGISALIAGLQPLVTALLVFPLLGERVSRLRWAGIAIGFLGALMVLAPSLGAVGAFPPVTIAVALAGTISITLGTIWQKRTAATADLRTNAVAQFVGATALTTPLALLLEDGRLDPTAGFLFGMVWAIFGLSIGAIALLLVLLRRGAVAGVAALLYLVPPVSAALAYVAFGETLTLIQMAGMAVAAAGVFIASRG